MANIFKSSIGKKLIMSVSGLFLILFLFVHAFVNSLSLISDEAFNAGCEFMALPVVTVIVPVLAFGFLIHIIYALVLSYGNLKARGSQRYAVANKAKTDDWAAKNMLVLGVIILLGIVLHLTHFWAKMQLADWKGDFVPAGADIMHVTFKSTLITILYIVWFVFLWLHLNHGFWSAIHTIGWNNDIWMKRWKAIGLVVSTLLVLVFIAVAINAHIAANAPLA